MNPGGFSVAAVVAVQAPRLDLVHTGISYPEQSGQASSMAVTLPSVPTVSLRIEIRVCQ